MFEPRSWQGVLDTTLCDNVCQLLGDRSVVFYPGIPVSSTNKTDRQDITKTELKVALNTINHKLFFTWKPQYFYGHLDVIAYIIQQTLYRIPYYVDILKILIWQSFINKFSRLYVS